MNCVANKSRKSCAQGHQICPTPWTCAGYENEAHFAAMTKPLRGDYWPREAAAKPKRKPFLTNKVTLVLITWLILAAIFFGPDIWAAIQTTWRTL